MKNENHSPIYIQYSSLIGQLVHKLNVLNREQKICYGLTLPQCFTIETLGQKNDQTMNQLSKGMGVSLSSMTRVVDVLVRDGILLRHENPQDRREVRISLSSIGQELNKKLNQCSEQYTRLIHDAIPANKRTMVLESIDILLKAINQVKQTCCRT